MKLPSVNADTLKQILSLLYSEPLLTMFLSCMAVVGFALFVVLKVVAG